MKRLALVCLALVSQLGVPTEASAVPDIQGKKCAKVGTYRTVKRVSYTCIKSGRSFVWKATKATTTTTTTPSTAVPDSKQFAFQYNLDKSLPEAWISEFQSIMKNLGETLPINPNIN